MNRRLPRPLLAFLVTGVILWATVAAAAPHSVHVHFGGVDDVSTVPVWLVGLVSLAACAFTAMSFGGSSVHTRVWLFATLSAILTFALTLVVWQEMFPSSAGLTTPIASAAAAAAILIGFRLLIHRHASTNKR